MKVTLYSLANSPCPKCRFTKRRFEDLEIPHEVVYADQDASVADFLKREVLDNPHGELRMPVVRVDLGGDEATWTWTDHRPTNIDRLHQLWKERVAA